MAYARFSDGDVYVFSDGESWTCCWCRLDEECDPAFDTLEELSAHLEKHQEAGHRVPQDCWDRIRYEMATGKNVFGGDL